jgi:bacterioferritin-associated ferredoxin
MYVCLCRAVTLDRLQTAVDGGALTVQAVAQACGAGSECGSCRSEIREVIRERLRSERRDDQAA